MRFWKFITIVCLIAVNAGQERLERFYSTVSAESYLKQNKECRMCWLRRSELSNLDLKHADLEAAELSGTDLNATNLENANMRSVRMRRADLTTVVSLRGADLSNADLLESNVHDHVLNLAILCDTILPNGQLSGCN